MLSRSVCGALLVLGSWGVTAAGQPPGSLGEKMVEFCKAHKGETVSTGECSALANTALRSVGAKTRGKDSPDAGDYTWGALVLVYEATPAGPRATTGKLGDLLPGDVVQFRDTKWEGPRRGGKGTYSMTLKHHTAVVAAAEGGGRLLRIFHQNYAGKRVVMDGTLYPEDLKDGWIRVYRPVPR